MRNALQIREQQALRCLASLALFGIMIAAGGCQERFALAIWPTATDTATATRPPTATATQTPAPTETATVAATHTETATPMPTDTPTPSPTVTPSLMPTDTAVPTHTPTAVPTYQPTSTPVPAATPLPTSAAPSAPAAAPAARQSSTGRLVLANYFAWYDAGGWGDCSISAGDKPAEPYGSDDPAAIARHIRQAMGAGIDGFTLQWFAPGERTDRNLNTLLEQSRGKPFRSTVIFLRQIWPGSPAATQRTVAESIRYLLDHYGGHPNFLTIGGKPVIIFADVYRVPVAGGETPQQAWGAIRAQADPQGRSVWIAEGLDPSYLDVFDGLYVYKVTHADYPQDYLKDARWATAVRQWERRTGKPKLWLATISPGWDDTRSGCRPDVRVPSKPHRVDRQNGAFYRATFDAAMGSSPDGLWINSFNEWVEGSYLEPSAQYGDRYLQLTRELIAAYKGS
jgi:hypothetical protein